MRRTALVLSAAWFLRWPSRASANCQRSPRNGQKRLGVLVLVVNTMHHDRYRLCGPRAQVVFQSEPGTYCARRSLTSYPPAVHMFARFGVRIHSRQMLRETPPCAGARSLNILTARKPTGLSARRRLRLLASHCMALTRECKNPSLISREIKIFSIFAWSVPTLVRINLKQGPSTYASEPQRRVRNFCSSLSEQSEL